MALPAGRIAVITDPGGAPLGLMEWDEDGGEALKYLEEKGYKRAIRMGVNDIYIREER